MIKMDVEPVRPSIFAAIFFSGDVYFGTIVRDRILAKNIVHQKGT